MSTIVSVCYNENLSIIIIMYNTRRVISKALFSSKKIYNKEECMKIIAKTAIEM